MISSLLQRLGSSFYQMCWYLGEIWVLSWEIVKSIVMHRIRWRLVIEQIAAIGFGSQLVVIVTGGFTGAVFAAQIYMKFQELGLSSSVGGLVSLAMSRELGPVLTAIMLTGRVGAGIAAEIGTMKVTEQVDALRSMSIHPVDYLVTPRMIAMIISVPLLISESVYFGIKASYLIAVKLYRVNASFYDRQLRAFTEIGDIMFGMTKGLAFGAVIVLIACHQGMGVRSGAVGVGRATNSAVVLGSLAILVSNFFLTILLSYFWPVSH